MDPSTSRDPAGSGRLWQRCRARGSLLFSRGAARLAWPLLFAHFQLYPHIWGFIERCCLGRPLRVSEEEVETKDSRRQLWAPTVSVPSHFGSDTSAGPGRLRPIPSFCSSTAHWACRNHNSPACTQSGVIYYSMSGLHSGTTVITSRPRATHANLRGHTRLSPAWTAESERHGLARTNGKYIF